VLFQQQPIAEEVPMPVRKRAKKATKSKNLKKRAMPKKKAAKKKKR